MNRLQNKVVVITGAGKGIGRAVANLFKKEGAHISVLSQSEKNISSLTAPIKMTGDVGKEKTVKEFISITMKKWGKIDILVNNAGFLAPKGPITDISTDDWNQSLQTNLTGCFLMMKHVLPLMKKQKEGLILNVNSGVAKRVAPDWGAYAISKSGLDYLTQLTEAEVKGSGIRINTINPGGIQTQMRAAAYPNEDPKTLPTPDQVAQLFLWLAAGEGKTLNGKWLEFYEWRKQYPDLVNA